MSDYQIRSLAAGDSDWVAHFIAEHWGSEKVVAHNEVYYPHHLPGFVAIKEGEPVGLITYRMTEDSCEIMSLNSVLPSLGIGTALIKAVEQVARRAHRKRLWLITTNDNLKALRFYQRRGFKLAAIYPEAVIESRKLKPEIPLIGDEGIPIRDEIELERKLG